MNSIRTTIGGLGNLLFKEAYILGQVFDGKLPDQYLQSEEYWEKHKDRIKAHFASGVGKNEWVAIHVRRGDYVNNPFYVDLIQTDYYQRAMAEFPEEHFMVFSDDIEWCKQQEVFKDCIYSVGLSDVDDLNRMASCKGHIIANSSFSWWGAYLSPHNGRVVAPKQWYADGVERTKCPQDWIRI